MSAVRLKEMELLQKRKERALVKKAAAKQGNGSVGRKSTGGRRKEIAAEKQAENWKSVKPQVSTLDLGGLKPIMDEVSRNKFGFICVRVIDLKGDSRFVFIPVHELLPPAKHRPPSLGVIRSQTPPGSKEKPVSSIDYTCVKKSKSSPFGRIVTTATAYPAPFYSPVLDEEVNSRYSSAVFVYPNLYVMASVCEHNSNFYALDLSSGGCWKKLPSMPFLKVSPVAISVKRDIYCFGSPYLTFGGSDGPFVDVYNVDRNRWTSVEANFVLPFHSVGTLTVPLKDDDGGIHILLHTKNHNSYPCTYDIAKSCFTLLPKKSLSSVVDSQPAVVDGVLYCFELPEGQLVGYDLNSSDRSVWTPIPVSGFSQNINLPVMRLHLLGIGNSMLCAVYTYLDTGLLVCTFFNMLKKEEMNKGSPPPTPTTVDHQPTTTVMILEAVHKRTKVYAIPGHGEILDCLSV